MGGIGRSTEGNLMTCTKGGERSPIKDPDDEFITKAVRSAQDAFWACIALCYHDEADTGDFPPDAQMAFDEACTDAVRTWTHYNLQENSP